LQVNKAEYVRQISAVDYFVCLNELTTSFTSQVQSDKNVSQ